MRKAIISNSFAKGVLDPHLSERTDLAHYFQSLAEADNVIVAPQGGLADRGGTQLVSDADVLAAGIDRRCRFRLEPVHMTAAMLTAPHGGTAALVIDQFGDTKLITADVAGTPWVVLEIDLGVVRKVDAVDVIGFSAATVGVNETLSVEWYNGSTWLPIGSSFDNASRKHIRTTRRTRRFAGWPGQSVFARNLRVVLYGAAGAGAISIAGVRLWRESAVLSPARLIMMARSSGEMYELVLTDRNIDVFRNMRWQAALPVPIAAEQIDEVERQASLDTLLLFHEDIETMRIVRHASDGEWDTAAPTWTNVPKMSVTTSFSGNQDEIQQINLGTVAAGQSVVVMLGDFATAPVVYINDATFAADLVTALYQLPGVAPIIGVGVVVTVTGPRRFRVAFVNTRGSRAWPLLTPIILGATIAAPATQSLQRGIEASAEALLWSATTGWPRCGAFHQSRLLLGGFRGAPTTYAASVVTLYYDFDVGADPLTADRGFVRSIDVDEIEIIETMFVGRHLQLFTTSGEWYIESRVLDATQANNAVLATRHGIAKAVPLVFADGSTVFVQKGGQTLRDFLWRDGEQSYSADPLSVLGPHLLTDVVDVAHRSARSVHEGNQVLMINADGSAAMLTLLRTQEVVAIAPWSTPAGQFRRCASSLDHTLFLLVERAGALRLEKWVPDMPLDAATRVGAGVSVIGNLQHLNGQPAWVYLDDDLIGPITITGGSLTLPRATTSYAVVGLAPAFRARLPVVRAKPNEERPFRPPARIYQAELSLDNTGDVTIGANGGPHRSVSLLRTDGAHARGGPLQTLNGGNPQLPMLQRLYTGNRRVEGMTGWTESPFVEISRSMPAPVRVKSVRLEVAHNG